MRRQQEELKGLKGTEAVVNSVATKPCYRCGSATHEQKDCPFKNVDCFTSGKRGHIAVCWSKKASQVRQSSPCPGVKQGKKQFNGTK